jgi:hypothetical protein
MVLGSFLLDGNYSARLVARGTKPFSRFILRFAQAETAFLLTLSSYV